MRRMSEALGDIAERAIEAFKEAFSLKAVTTHDGMIKAMSLKAARAMMAPAQRSRGRMIGLQQHNHRCRPLNVLVDVPVWYRSPEPVRLNRSHKWGGAPNYGVARLRAAGAGALA
jgi:hypothetical protein